MDDVQAGDTAQAPTHVRRSRMRARARGLRPLAPSELDVFQTPEWLERSFVLPLTEPEVSDVPSQSVPHHDDYRTQVAPSPESDPTPASAPAFVRPPTNEIDFAKMIRRADLSRTASRSAMGSTGVAGLLLVVYLLTSAALILGMAIAFALVALVAVAVRVRLATASIPHL
jgi:hypothetical protein